MSFANDETEDTRFSFRDHLETAERVQHRCVEWCNWLVAVVDHLEHLERDQPSLRRAVVHAEQARASLEAAGERLFQLEQDFKKILAGVEKRTT